MDAEPHATPHAVRLPPVMDGPAASVLRDEFLTHRGRDLRLDGGEVTRIGGLCLQVLLAARADWAAEGRGFDVVDPSPDLIEGLTLLGASDLLSHPATEGARL